MGEATEYESGGRVEGSTYGFRNQPVLEAVSISGTELCAINTELSRLGDRKNECEENKKLPSRSLVI